MVELSQAHTTWCVCGDGMQTARLPAAVTRATGNAKAFDCMVPYANMHYYLVAGGASATLYYGMASPILSSFTN